MCTFQSMATASSLCVNYKGVGPRRLGGRIAPIFGNGANPNFVVHFPVLEGGEGRLALN